MSPALVRSVVAEFLGTALLVLIAVGAAVTGIDTVGAFGVALAFGLVLLALAYAIGPISGCHINPAVTLAVLLSRGMTAVEAAWYWAAQIAGGIVGAALLALLTSGFGDVVDQTGALGANDYGATISLGGAFLIEALLTLAFVTVIR
jgi:aquaporin Z